MFRLLSGLMILAAILSFALVTNNAYSQGAAPAPAATGTATPVESINLGLFYKTLPAAAGQRTLIDFNDFNKILEKTQAYRNQRYEKAPKGSYSAPYDKPEYNLSNLKEKDKIAPIQDAVGAEDGMPIEGFVRDTDGHADVRKTRPITEVDKLVVATDRLRTQQVRIRDLRDQYGADKTKDAIIPDLAKARELEKNASNVGRPFPRDKFGSVQYSISEEDMMLDNWQIELNSSARTPVNRDNSYCKEIKAFKNLQDPDPKAAPRTYLGIRVHFPNHKYNANAKIGPAFDIPAFDSRGLPLNYSMFDPDYKDGIAENDPSLSYNGVMHNVDQIKNIVSRVAGRNYPHGFAVRLRDQNDDVQEYFLGYLNYGGWKYLRWENPNYIHHVGIDELFRIPLYPTEIPFRVFDSFIVYRNGSNIGGDFVTYVDWVRMDFDLAVAPDELKEIDVDDDSWWYIFRDANAERNEKLLKKYADEIDLRMQVEARRRGAAVFPDMRVNESLTKDPKDIKSAVTGAGTPAPAPAPPR